MAFIYGTELAFANYHKKRRRNVKTERKSDLQKLFDYAGKFKVLTISSWILSILSALLALVPFIFIWRIIREVLNVNPNLNEAQGLAYNGWMAVLFAILSMLIYICALMCSHIAAFRVQANIRLKAMHHILTLPMGFMDNIGSGKLRKIVNESSAATESYLAHQLPDMAGAYATPIGLLFLLIVFDWRLGLLSLIPVVFAFAIMSLMTGKKMKVKMVEYQNSLDQMSNEAVEYVRGIPVVKTFGQSVFSFKKFKTSIDEYEKWVISYTKDLRIPMTFYTVMINAVFAILIAAAILFTTNGISNEFLLNILYYIIITPVITVTLNKIMFSSENKLIVADSLSRIDAIMEMEPLSEPTISQKPQNNSVELNHVSFKYDNARENALKDISISIKNGEHIALVGPSGGGKTTLGSIIARFWDVCEGTVTIGGIDICKITKQDLMNTVSFVFQDSKLLKTSIFENVRMAKKTATRQEVLNALHDAQCDDIIEKLPHGIDTIVGSKGIFLSGGEQQRIAIARIMLKNSPILVLDEATAFADPDNEIKVQMAFSKLSQGKTVIMIAHRLSTVIDCDKIYVLQNGSIVESGSHNELLKADGVYLHMWNEYSKAANWKVGDLHD